MLKRMLLTALLLAAACAAFGDEAIDAEIAACMERLKSPDAATRAAAVADFVAVRETAWIELDRAVKDADAGLIPQRSKRAALLIMGQMRLLQARALFEAQQDWTFVAAAKNDPLHKTLVSDVVGKATSSSWPARAALQELGEAARVSLVDAPLAAGSKDAFPALRQALQDLRSHDADTIMAAQNRVGAAWMSVGESLVGVLATGGPSGDYLYSPDVRIAAAHVAGELRVLAPAGALSRLIDLRDEKGLAASYPSRLRVDTPDAAYPCAVALVKIGSPRVIGDVIAALKKEGDQAARERLARTAMAMDSAWARREYEGSLASSRSAALPGAEQAAERLESVASLFAD